MKTVKWTPYTDPELEARREALHVRLNEAAEELEAARDLQLLNEAARSRAALTGLTAMPEVPVILNQGATTVKGYVTAISEDFVWVTRALSGHPSLLTTKRYSRVAGREQGRGTSRIYREELALAVAEFMLLETP